MHNSAWLRYNGLKSNRSSMDVVIINYKFMSCKFTKKKLQYFSSAKSLTCQKPCTRFSKHVRNFRKGRNNVKAEEDVKVDRASLETPFSNVQVASGDLNVGKLWKPLAFTVGVSWMK